MTMRAAVIGFFLLTGSGFPGVSHVWAQQAGEYELGEIVRNIGSETKTVRIVSNEPDIASMLDTAFRTHGAYTVMQAGPVDFTFRFSPAGPSTMRLDVESGSPAKVLFTREVSGAERRDAALRAGDLAVLKTTGVPGYFAGRLTFIGNRTGMSEVYVADMFFASARRLTNKRAHCVGPAFAPDGRAILYTTYFRNGFPDIYRLDAGSGAHSVFASYKGTNVGGVFNPRGDRVAMVLSGSGNAELYVSNAMGSDIRRLTRTERAVEADPTWSPDGQRIIFTSDQLGKPQLFQIPVNGGRMQRVPTNISNYNSEADWNPRDPNVVVFTIREGRYFRLALFDFSKRNSVVISPAGVDAVEGCWTNDGRHLVYTEWQGKQKRLRLLDAVTGRTSPLHADELGSAWQADFLYELR